MNIDIIKNLCIFSDEENIGDCDKLLELYLFVYRYSFSDIFFINYMYLMKKLS